MKPKPKSPNGKRKRNGARDPRRLAPFGVVGLGASAGGIAVLQKFFEGMPADSGLAFVVVMHLSPEFESNLPEVLQRTTAMPVVQVHAEEKVKPNHVYVIPPNKHLTLADNTLQLSERQQAPGRRVAIDLFFRTLAEAFGQRAVCVVLTGSDSDGVIGLKHIKAQGGVTIAQEPSEAEYDSMPRSAIATGMVDWVLPVEEMPRKLLEFVENEKRMELPPEHANNGEAVEEGLAIGGETVARVTDAPEDENALQEVLRHLRAQTSHDFSHYKRATVLRRIARRLQVNSIENIPSYLEYLRSHHAEARALLQDLLIGVTHFFRDRDSFAALEANIPQLFSGKRSNDQVRVWVPACATGEEAYSIAMLLCEQAQKLENPPSVQVFATDIDEESIADARSGVYPPTIEADVSQERLRQFFARDHGRYRVKKEIRETVLFAPHDLLQDPPFSRLDLISCRNLLIYLKRGTQARVLDIFHFALRPGGLLFIGGSESVEDAQLLFAALEKQHRLYVRRAAPRPAWLVPSLPRRILSRTPDGREMPRLRPPPMRPMSPPAIVAPPDEKERAPADDFERRTLLFGQVHLQLLEKYGPPSIVINETHDVVHLSEHAGRYLRFGGGEPTANLLALVHPALRIELRTAIFRARQDLGRVTIPEVQFELDGEPELLDVHVQVADANDAAHGFALILFDKKHGPATSIARGQPLEEPLAQHLEEELQHVKSQLSSTVEQYEASNEELKASNEELQAMNEEVRSTAEELETSKEELQSINEELSTLNHELKNSVEQLSRANSDLQNLMAATDIGTIFLDRQLRINRYTPAVQEVFNVLPSDIGRPLSDLTHKLNYRDMTADAEAVLDRLTPIETEVRAGGDTWFLCRLKPYRTTEDRIDGVVITFVEITERKRMEEELRTSAERLRQAFEVDTVGVFFFNTDGTVTDANRAFLAMSGYSREDLENGKVRWDAMTPPKWMARSREAMREFQETGRTTTYEKEYIRRDGTLWWGLFTAARLEDGSGVKYILDITARKEAEKALGASEARFRQFAENSADVLWIIDRETGQLDYISPAYERIWGEPRADALGDPEHSRSLIHPDDRAHVIEQLLRLAEGETFVQDYRVIRPNDGETRWIRDTGFPIRDENGAIIRLAGVAQDITADKMHLAALAESEERYRLLVDGARDYAIFMIEPGNHIVYWSAGAERVFGWTAEEALGKHGRLIFTPEDRAQKREEKELAIALKDGCANDRRWHMRKDGSRIWVDGVMSRLDDEKGNLRGFAKVARDATEQRLAADALERSRHDLEHRVKDRTAALTAANRKLAAEIKQRAELEQELLLVSEREKRRIGQDLHDSLCQELAAAAFFLKSSAQKIGEQNPAASNLLTEAAQIVNDNVGLARDLARGLHPVEMGTAGLSNALRELAFRTSQEGVTCEFQCPRPIRVRDEGIALNLYRIAQEAVTNAVKNGEAGRITVGLARERSRLILTVQDNGKGFSAKKRTKGMGLHLMKYRANTIGGTFEVKSADGHGAIVTCTVPKA